jgi:PDZ domain-containing secreted protein
VVKNTTIKMFTIRFLVFAVITAGVVLGYQRFVAIYPLNSFVKTDGPVTAANKNISLVKIKYEPFYITSSNYRYMDSPLDWFEYFYEYRTFDAKFISMDTRAKAVTYYEENLTFEQNDKSSGNENILNIVNQFVEPEITPDVLKKREYHGDSSELMIALELIQEFGNEDVTKGRVIAGTGTILSNGKVGKVGGIPYKVTGANKFGADIFIVPHGSNYEEAQQTANLLASDIEIVSVKTMNDALAYLRK